MYNITDHNDCVWTGRTSEPLVASIVDDQYPVVMGVLKICDRALKSPPASYSFSKIYKCDE